MANDYLTFEEVCATLGKSVEEVKILIADGLLSEIRDGDRVFYKRADVEQIAAKEGSSIVDLDVAADVTAAAGGGGEGESFASALSNLADSSSGLDLLDESAEEGAEGAAPEPMELDVEAFPEELPAAPREPVPAEPTSDIDLQPAESPPQEAGAAPEVPDLGLSGSSIISLDPSPEEAKAEEQAPAEEAAAAPKKVGISVFDDDELDIESDPMGETHVTASVGDLDGSGSGSGLLDLTRETDDTSLEPLLQDVISPIDAAETETESEPVEAEPMEDSVAAVAAAQEEPYEPAVSAPAPRAATGAAEGEIPLTVSALLGISSLALLGLAAAAQVQGIWPEFMNTIASGTWHYAVFGGVALIAIVTGLIGILAGRGR